MNELLGPHRASRHFRVKFPEEVVQENLGGQLWFGAECLTAGSSIMHKENESALMRPMAKALIKSLENVRNLLREQCFRNAAYPTSSTLNLDDASTEALYENLKIFDQLFADFEFLYVSAMVQVKTAEEYEAQQVISVLFSEALQHALRKRLLTQEQVDSYDPALMFSIPRLGILAGLLYYHEGVLHLAKEPEDMSEMFKPFKNLLTKMKDLLYCLSKTELHHLELMLCSNENSMYSSGSMTSSTTNEMVVNEINAKHCGQSFILNSKQQIFCPRSGRAVLDDDDDDDNEDDDTPPSSVSDIDFEVMEGIRRLTENDVPRPKNPVAGAAGMKFVEIEIHAGGGPESSTYRNSSDAAVESLCRVIDRTNSYNGTNSYCPVDCDLKFTLKDDDDVDILEEKRLRKRSATDKDSLLHRLFVCIASVADQLQTNFAADLRQILKSVFLMNSTPTVDECIEETEVEPERFSHSDIDLSQVEQGIEAMSPSDSSNTVEEASIQSNGICYEDDASLDNEQSNAIVPSEPQNIVPAPPSPMAMTNPILLESPIVQSPHEPVPPTLSSTPVTEQLMRPPRWIPDNEAPRCMSCVTQFTPFRRRHHCRNCGGVYCNVCSNFFVPLPKYGLKNSVRVCKDCYSETHYSD